MLRLVRIVAAAALAFAFAIVTPALATWIWPGDVPPAIHHAFTAKAILRNEIVYTVCPHPDTGTPVLTAYRGFITWEHVDDPVAANDRQRGITRRERYDVQYKFARYYDELGGSWGEWYEVDPADQMVFKHDVIVRNGKARVSESSCHRPTRIPAG